MMLQVQILYLKKCNTLRESKSNKISQLISQITIPTQDLEQQACQKLNMNELAKDIRGSIQSMLGNILTITDHTLAKMAMLNYFDKSSSNFLTRQNHTLQIQISKEFPQAADQNHDITSQFDIARQLKAFKDLRQHAIFVNDHNK